MNARKDARIQRFLQVADAIADGMGHGAHMQLDIVAIGLNPVDIGGADEEHPTILLHQNPAGVLARGRGLPRHCRRGLRKLATRFRESPDRFQQHVEPFRRHGVRALRAGLAEGGFEAFGVHRLEHVVHRVHIEGLLGVLVICRDKEHHGHVPPLKCLEHPKPIKPGHLDIKAHQIGLQLPDECNRLLPALGLANHLDLVFRLEEATNPLPRQPFIVHNEYTHAATLRLRESGQSTSVRTLGGAGRGTPYETPPVTRRAYAGAGHRLTSRRRKVYVPERAKFHSPLIRRVHVPSMLPVTLADEGVRQRRVSRILFAVLWVIPSVLAALQLTLIGDASGTHYRLSTTLVWQGASWMLWGLWSQLVLTIVDRVKLDTARIAPWIAIHVAVSAVICVINVLLIAWLDHVFGAVGRVTSYALAVRVVLVNHLDFQVVLYWAVVGAAYMVKFVRRFQERDRAATVLQQELASTQLEALRMQLNPHFLFNALNSVAELMENDVREAQRTLTRVADLLRLSLRSAGSSLIPVWQEIELVELYLQIARVRYGQGLDADITVDPSAVDDLLPSFLLQPLVENALKHGLAPGHPDQSIEVHVHRDGAVLKIIVEDNGRGLDGLLTTSGRFMAVTPSVDGLGIGLTNTRMRLSMLYGDRYAFRMSNLQSGGCRVEIRIPATDR